jgi:YbbR domain-containing protein
MLDPGRTVLSIILAFGLWVVVLNEQNPERTQMTPFQIPVEVERIPDGVTLVTDQQPTVQLWVRAPENVWPRLRQDSFRAYVDASGSTAGLRELPVQVEINDAQVRAAEPRPSSVRIRLEEVRERSVPAKVNLVGNVPFGYSTGQLRITPERVTVIGPESLVQRVDAALVDLRLDGVTVNLSGAFNARPVDARDNEVRGVRVVPAQVSVELPVHQEVTYKEVGIRPATTGRLAPGYYLLPLEVDPQSATVVGHPDLLSTVTVLETEPVNVSDVTTTVVRRTSLRLPRGVSLLQPQLTVLVTVRVEPLEITQSIRVLPTVEGLPQDLVLSSPLQMVELSVSGPAPTLQQLSPRDFRVTLSLADLGPGRHVVQPRAMVPVPFELERVEPRTVTVELRQVEPAPTAMGDEVAGQGP